MTAGPTPASALEIDCLSFGKAAEHLVCAELLFAGYHAFLADQGSPFDIVVSVGGRLLRVQVKATSGVSKISSRRDKDRYGYSWNIRGRGNGRKGDPLGSDHCDLVALVAADIRVIAWFPLERLVTAVRLLAPGVDPDRTAGGQRPWARALDGYPFEMAVRNNPDDYQRSVLTHCPAGHAYAGDNRLMRTRSSSDDRLTLACRECGRVAARSRAARRRG